MPYSAVTQPRPVLRRNAGIVSSTLAVHSTRVSPNSISTEPSAWRVKSAGDAHRRAARRARGRWVCAFMDTPARSATLSAEPAQHGGSGVVAERRRCLHGAAAERFEPGAQLLAVVAEERRRCRCRAGSPRCRPCTAAARRPAAAACRPLIVISGNRRDRRRGSTRRNCASGDWAAPPR